uniref:Bifunctional pinoresinol-lariciresinol reductase n=1 Tax=Linum album TaxID=191219 RepID=PILR1_LINAL|nr:RecName: Full=Bifunctional pinoresinol-lariciresinol reductase; Short=PLR-La1; AltName: Full=(+)-lariciresinol reductase; AltName: Full=(+)-pinoresinol reductase [Linum album]CAH60857.1 pinoresinol-lariciresinol reductase [Linum album]
MGSLGKVNNEIPTKSSGGSKVLVIGGTGYLGKRLVKASLDSGHDTYVMHRPEIGVDIEKVQLLLSFKMQGAHLVSASFDDQRSLVDAVKLVDVVICAISGVHIRSHQILLQLKLVEAIKEAGNVKRFVPSEFGTDPARMENAMEPGRITFDDKMVVRRAIEEAGIPFTYVSANCFAGYFLGGLCQPGYILPSRDHVTLLGDGDKKGVYVDEDDTAAYTLRAIDDPRTLNKTIYVKPPKNVLSQREVVGIWEKYIGKELQKTILSEQDFLATMREQNYAEQVGLTHYYHVCYEGCLSNFEVDDEQEASKLYPDVHYTTVEEYLKRYV